MRLAVVGHVEWVDFLVTPHIPGPGEILHVDSAHEGPGGGGAMAAHAMRALTGACAFYCAVGDDVRGEETIAALTAAGLEVHAAMHPCPQRRCVTHLTGGGERAITVLGARLVPEGADVLPWDALAGVDGVCFMAGDAEAMRRARAAPVLVAAPRMRDELIAAAVQVDVLVGSADDPSERADDALLAATRPRLVVQTEGERGGAWRAADGTRGRWEAAPLPGAPVDDYGCGDAFAAALTAGLAAGRSIEDACALGARVGAGLLCERAPAVGDLTRLWDASRDE